MKTLNQKKPRLGYGLKQALACTVLCAMVSTTNAQTLTHRWSFNDASDSVGTASVSLTGAATISGGTLNVFGASGAGDFGSVDISSDYTNYTSSTIECWFTTSSIQDWSKVWMFGNGGNQADVGTTYQDFTSNRGGVEAPGISIKPAPQAGDSAYAGTAQIPQGVETHAVATYDYGANTITLYINGVWVCSGSMQNTTISNLACTEYRFGAGTSWGDPSFNGTIDEMRVYNGPLTPAQAEADYEAGPNSASGTPGALTSIQFNNGANVIIGGKFTPVILATYVSLTNKVNVSHQSGVSYSSDDPSVVSFGTDGNFHAMATGTTTIRATYQSQPAALAVTVSMEPAVILHRYSFNGASGTTAITDSVGSANGTLVNGSGTSTLTGSGQLTLDGNLSSAYVSLPSGMMAALTNATFVTWVNNQDPNSDWAELWAFGTNNGAQGLQYVTLIPNNGASHKLRLDDSQGSFDAPFSLPLTNEVCVTVTYNYSAQTGTIYVGGRKVATGTMTLPLSTLPDGDNYIGQSEWYGSGDPYLNAILDEFRIYTGVESDLQIAVDAAAGPDAVIASPGALLSVTVSSPSTDVDAHGTGVPIQVLANFANVSGVDVTTLSETTITSSDHSVGTIVNGIFTPQNVGVSTVTATYSNIPGSLVMNVVDTNAWPSLLHRWTFNDAPGSTTIADSVGAINGTVYGPVTNTGSELQMPLGNPPGGGDGLPTAASGWASFPANQGLVTGLPNEASFEIWVVWNGGGVWQEMFDFGQAATPGVSLGGGQYVMICPQDGANNVLRAEWDQNPAYDVTMQGTAPLPVGVLCQIVWSHDQDRQLDKLYLNGQLVTSAVNTALWSTLPDTDNWLARDEWPDPMFNGNYSDMRIWNGALTAGQVANAYAAGPNVIVGPALQVSPGGSQITLKWPANATGFVLQSTTNLGGGTWSAVSGTPTVLNGLNSLTVPASQAQTYYRLKQ